MAFRSATNVADSASGTNVTINKPAGCVAGDILILATGAGGAFASGPTIPAAFTVLGSTIATGGSGSVQSFVTIAWRYCDGSEPSSWTFSTNNNGNQIKGAVLLCFSGRAASPIGTNFLATSASADGASPVSVALLGITPDQANSDLVWIATLASNVGSPNATLTGPGGSWTDPAAGQAATGFLNYGSSYLANQPASATGTLTGTGTVAAGTFRWGGVVLALKMGGPTVTVNPTDQTVNDGSNPTFSVTASAQLGSLTYQWQDDSTGSFANVSGATSSSYTPTGLSYSANNRRYRCVVSDSVGSATSNSAELHIAFKLTGTNGRARTAFGSVFGYGPWPFELLSSSTLNNYTITADQGAYTLTGQVALLKRGLKVPAVQGSYTLNGQTANLVRALKLTAIQGSYSLTGQAAGLLAAHKMPAVQGSYALTGQAASLRYNRLALAAVQGSYALTGQIALLKRALKVAAVQGAYALTGQTAALRYNRLALAAVQGSYSLSGQAATLLRALRVTASQGAYVLSGQAAALRPARTLPAAQGSYALTGQAAILRKGLVMPAGQGSYALNGQATILVATRKLLSAQGSYALTGQAALLKKSTRMPAVQGAYALNGQAATLVYAIPNHPTLVAVTGSYALTGQASALKKATLMSAVQGSYALAGQAATLRRVFTALAAQGSFALVGQATTLRRASRLDAAQGSFALLGQTVVLRKSYPFSAAQGSYSLTGQPVEMRFGKRMLADFGSYALTGIGALLVRTASEGTYDTTLIWYVPAEPRLFDVAAEPRSFTIDAEARTFEVGS